MTEPRRRNRRGDATARTVLDVAESNFLEHGFAGARVDDIAAAAFVSVGTIYQHFGNKEGLFAATLERAQEVLLVEYIDPIFALVDLSPWGRIEAYCHGYIEFFLDHEHRARLLGSSEFWHEETFPAHIHARMRERVRERDDKMRAIFQEAADRGELQGADPRLANRFTWASLYGICALNMRHADISLTPEQLRALVAVGVKMLSGGRAPGASGEP